MGMFWKKRASRISGEVYCFVRGIGGLLELFLKKEKHPRASPKGSYADQFIVPLSIILFPSNPADGWAFFNGL